MNKLKIFIFASSITSSAYKEVELLSTGTYLQSVLPEQK